MNCYSKNSTSEDRKLIKQQYLALCIPNVAFENSTKRLSSIRYCNPEVEDFKKPSVNEAVVVPVNLVHKPGNYLKEILAILQFLYYFFFFY